MACALPRAAPPARPALAHFQHALPLRCPCPAVVTVHDLSFERDPSRDGPTRPARSSRPSCPRAVRRADRVLAVSERTKDDLVELYGIASRDGSS